jgi:phosphoserine aminotransferase
VPDIRIPTDLLPSDGRFGCGPSKVRPEAVTALASEASTYLGTSHRQPRVKTVVGDLRAGLTELFTLPDGYEVVLGNGGSTLFWDAAAFGLVRRRSEHLVFGEFSSKFATVTRSAPFLDDPKVVESPTGTRPNVEIDADIDAYCLTQNETSTGVMMPLQRPAGVDAADALVLVDATSGAGGLRFDPNQVDAYYFAPQKSLDPLEPVDPRGLHQQSRRPDPQHPRAGHPVPHARAGQLDERQWRPRVGRGAMRHLG